MNYKKVDFSTWPRGDLFQFYMDHMRMVMSLTVDMDVTPLVRFVKTTAQPTPAQKSTFGLPLRTSSVLHLHLKVIHGTITMHIM